jgi:molybdenum cofactor cytidylyltransferase
MIGAVVLAAGASSRVGVPKWSLPVSPDGPSFLDAILATLRAVDVSAVRVVVAPGAAPLEGAVVNPEPARGMLSSVQCGLRALPPDVGAVLLWPVDHPLVTTATVREMLRARSDGNPPVVVPTFEGRRGHPVLFDARVLPELLAADPGVGARAVVHAHRDRRELPVLDRGIVAGIDTREDYRRAFGREVPRPTEVP